MTISRRRFMHGGSLLAAAVVGGSALPVRAHAAEPIESERLLDLHAMLRAKLEIASVELLRSQSQWLVRVRSRDGAEGLAAGSEQFDYLYSIFLRRVAPFFLGKDAREIETLVDGVYVFQSNYKLAGVPFWVCVGCLEAAVFDLLGKAAEKPVAQLLGGIKRKSIPVYLSSLRRDTTPEEEVRRLAGRLEETGARAVKLKIGGKMSRNRDASPGRTERLVPLARQTFGDQVAIYVDANGSYDAAKAIEIGRMLAEHKVAFFEEPCPWEDFEATKQVADALDLPIAGGEQDTSWEKISWMVRHRAVDIIQPDVMYCGGFVRAMRIARLAERHALEITPHAPQAGLQWATLAQFAAAVPNLGRFQEYNAAASPPAWMSPALSIRAGEVEVPTCPGLGVAIDPRELERFRPFTEA